MPSCVSKTFAQNLSFQAHPFPNFGLRAVLFELFPGNFPCSRKFEPEAATGPLFPGTRKGTVAHLPASPDSLARQLETAAPAWVVFPKYQAGAPTDLRPIVRSRAFIQLANNSFNYRLKGESGFLALTTLVRDCACYQLSYSDLTEATDMLASLPSRPT